jgi:hypothetical protein
MFLRIFIASSYFIETLGGKYVDMEMPKLWGRFGENRVTFFRSRGANKSKIAFEDE